jgi:hypothetical protein
VTRQQIQHLGLQTRPTKAGKNSHAKHWKEGDSVELDAIPANLLRAMVDECIRSHVPDGHVEAMARVEAAERETLAHLAWMSTEHDGDHGLMQGDPR